MAQDEKKGDDYEFRPPDFDEDAFIHKELVSFRTTVILFLWGIVAALVAWGIFAAMGGPLKTRWLLGLVVGGLAFAALPVLFRKLGADTKHFGRREWIGTGFLFFFSFLAFFILLVNPPVSDYAPPVVTIHAGPPVQEPGGDVAVDLFVEDNVAVTAHAFTLTRDGQPEAGTGDLTGGKAGHYQYVVRGAEAGTYALSASAEDGRGHAGAGAAAFTVQAGVITFDATGANVLEGPADQAVVLVDDLPTCRVRRGVVAGSSDEFCVRTVRLQMVDSQRNVTLKWDSGDGAWVATLQHAGWAAGNNTFHVVAELADRFQGSVRIEGGAVEAGPFAVEVTGTPGDDVIPVAADPKTPQRNVPGPGIALALAGLVGAAYLVRRRSA